MQKKYRVRLSDGERARLEEVVKKLKGTGQKIRRAEIFREEADYEAFERILSEGLERYDVQLFAFRVAS